MVNFGAPYSDIYYNVLVSPSCNDVINTGFANAVGSRTTTNVKVGVNNSGGTNKYNSIRIEGY